ncbi:MAG: stealth family protein [Actinoplanes sp.]
MPLRRILRLAPWSVRRRVLRNAEVRLLPRLPAQRRLATARRLVPLSARPRLVRVAADAPTLRVRTSHGTLSAVRRAKTTPAAVRRENLDAVVAALSSAGIDWFRIPTTSLTGTAVAVAEPDRPAVLELLEELGSTDAGLLQIVRPAGRSGRRARQSAKILRFSRPVTDPAGNLVLGPEYGCAIEFWRPVGGNLVGPRSNPVADVVPADEPVVDAPEPVFGPFCAPDDPATYRTRELFTMVSPDRVEFPIDAVYTWVDGGDPAWLERKALALRDNDWVADVNRQTANDSRYVNRDELRYSLRALHAFAPWIRTVFLVTDDQVPAWLDTTQPGLTVVSHKEIFAGTGTLPTFNSQAIETRLHHIPGLSEHFVYLNDDVFLGRPVAPELFFTPGGLTRFFPSGSRVDSAPRGPADRPANSAGKNNRKLIQEAFGRVLTRKMKHTPHPSRRSVLNEIELRFAEHVEATAGHQFRHPDDIAPLSSLQQYYAYLTGRAAPGDIRYLYTDVADPHTPFRLAKLLHSRNLDAFCLNDTDSDPAAMAEQTALLAEFLPTYLPFPSPYELSTPRPATASLTAPRPPAARQVPRLLPGSPIHPERVFPAQPAPPSGSAVA